MKIRLTTDFKRKKVSIVTTYLKGDGKRYKLDLQIVKVQENFKFGTGIDLVDKNGNQFFILYHKSQKFIGFEYETEKGTTQIRLIIEKK